MKKENVVGLGEFQFYKNYFIGKIYAGVNAGPEFVNELTGLIQKYFSGKPVVYISNRVNSYSLDPSATIDLINRNNIRFAGVVNYTKSQEHVYQLEEQILNGITMRSFNSLDHAVEWAEQKSLELN